MQKIHETSKLESIHEKHCVERKMREENQTKTRSLCPECSTKNAVQGFHLWSEEKSSKILRINSPVNVKRELMQIPDLVTLSL